MFVSISLTTHSCFFQFMRSLIYLGSVLATYGGFLHFGKSMFLSCMICLHTNRFSYGGCTIYVHYYSILFNGMTNINIHLFIHVIQSLFSSLFFLCMLMIILSRKIYFLCFLLASLLIALKLLLLHGIRDIGRKNFQSSTCYHIISTWYQRNKFDQVL